MLGIGKIFVIDYWFINTFDNYHCFYLYFCNISMIEKQNSLLFFAFLGVSPCQGISVDLHGLLARRTQPIGRLEQTRAKFFLIRYFVGSRHLANQQWDSTK